ncbi:MAG: NitT/TauT family transport system permease protein [Thermotogaceae bacterium]|nr:NitT/TauT family transport system permease protein [Thermotogaceae bacterium]MDN5337639.1 NitT/TauT family transport system permease protein [Thermotogaceae bacterium]
MKKILGILIALILWEIATLMVNSELLLPSPFKTIVRLIQLITTGELFSPLLSTFLKAFAGFALAIFFGFIVGFVMGLNQLFYELLRPLISIVQSVPIVSWLALAILWWGIGNKGPVVIVFITLFPVIALNVYEGVLNIDKKLVEMAKVYKVRKIKIFRDIYLGSLLPFIVSAVSVSSGLLWKSVVVAEFMAGSKGIGVEISWAKSKLETVDVFAYTLLLVFLGILSEVLLRSIEKRFSY